MHTIKKRHYPGAAVYIYHFYSGFTDIQDFRVFEDVFEDLADLRLGDLPLKTGPFVYRGDDDFPV